MGRLVKWLSLAVAAVVLLTIAAMAALPWVVDTPRVQSLIASSAAQALARPVKFQSLHVSVLPYPVVRLGKLEVAEDPTFGAGAFLRLDDAHLRLKLWPLLRGRIEFGTLVLKQPTIVLLQGSDRRWNFSSLGAARETGAVPRALRSGGAGVTPAPLVSRILIEEGLVTYETHGPGGAASRRRLEKVDLTLSSRAGAVSFSGSARVMPGDVAVRITDGTLGLGGGRTLADGSLRATVTFVGDDVRPVVAAALGPEPAIAGAIAGRLNVTGTVSRPRATGEVELKRPEVTRTNPECAEPKRRKLALWAVKANVVWDDGRLVVQSLATGLGDGSITSKLSATPAPHPLAELSDLVVKGLALERVLVDFLCQPYAVAGPLDLTGALALSPTDPIGTLSGKGRLRIGQGKIMGVRALALLGGIVRLGSAVSSALRLDVSPSIFSSPIEFDSITATYQIRDGVVTTRDLLYTSRAMTIKMIGDYVLPTDRVNFDVVLDYGRGQLQAKVTGTAASPSIRVAPPAMLRQVDPGKVERGLKDLLGKFR